MNIKEIKLTGLFLLKAVLVFTIGWKLGDITYKSPLTGFMYIVIGIIIFFAYHAFYFYKNNREERNLSEIIIFESLKDKWLDLNERYDSLVLDMLDDKDVDIKKMKEMQKELFEIETEIFQRTSDSDYFEKYLKK